MYSMFVSLKVKYEFSQSIHIPSRFDCSVWMPAKCATNSRQRRANSAIPYSSISRFEFSPRPFSTCTSTWRPCESKPFW